MFLPIYSSTVNLTSQGCVHRKPPGAPVLTWGRSFGPSDRRSPGHPGAGGRAHAERQVQAVLAARAPPTGDRWSYRRDGVGLRRSAKAQLESSGNRPFSGKRCPKQCEGAELGSWVVWCSSPGFSSHRGHSSHSCFLPGRWDRT